MDEKEMDKWINRYQSALPDVAPPEQSVENTIRPVSEIPPFYEGKRPRYRLIHINWNFPKRLKRFKNKGGAKDELNKDVLALSRPSPTGTRNDPMTSTPAQSSSTKTIYRWTFSTKRKDSNQSIPSSVNINGDSRQKGSADGVQADDLLTNTNLQKVLAQITAIKKKMKYKAAIIDQLSSEKWKHSSFKVGWRPYPCYCNFSGAQTIMLTPTWSQDSDLDQKPSP